MAESPPPSMSQKNPSSPSSPPATTMTDLDADALAHCATYLSLIDVSNMSMTCKYLHNVAYSDSIWNHLFRLRWPNQTPSGVRVREAYLSQRTKTLQFRFSDPFVVDDYTDEKPVDHVLLNQNAVIISKGSVITIENIVEGQCERGGVVRLTDHNARITCMRTFPLCETSLYRSETQTEENVLVTSSSDHSIRLWWKGSCRRCLRGHHGPVTALSDKLVGNGTGKLLASGGEDGTVRLWSLNSKAWRGQRALKATFHGHEKPIKLISVAGHKTSLLVTISGDSKVRLWDANAASAARSSCCVGMTSVPGPLVNMKCHEQLLYVAAGSSVAAIDMRTMHKVLTCAVDEKLYSFEAIPSNSLFCVGGSNGRAMLYDVRKIKVPPLKSEAVAELDGGHTGPLTHLHMDEYKIVTGGPLSPRVHVWESNTGASICSWCFENGQNLDAMAVNGCRIVTASTDPELGGLVTLKDFRNASCALVNNEDDRLATNVKSLPTGVEFPCFPKFWNQQSDSDSETE